VCILKSLGTRVMCALHASQHFCSQPVVKPTVRVQFQQALERVRAGADVMPQGQLHKVIEAELGVNWRNRMATFEDEPLAAASIGQVSPL